MHYCCQCGHEIPRREKFCPNCGNQIEYLCALPPIPVEPQVKRKSHAVSSLTRWVFIYIFAVALSFALSYFYFSSPELQAWLGSSKKVEKTSATNDSVQPASATVSAAKLKSSFNQLAIVTQKTAILIDNLGKVHVAGDPARTAVNYRTIQRDSEALLGQLNLPPDSSPETSAVLAPLKETLMLLSKSAIIMADYLDGKLSLAPPNPDWVARSQEYSAQARARLKQTQEALSVLRKKFD